MGSQANKPVKEFTDMVAAEKAARGQSKLYRAQSMEISDERISESVETVLTELINAKDQGKRVSLSDTEAVKNYSLLYLQSCEMAASIPTMSGLARSMGFSRRAIYAFKQRNPKHPTSEWLELIHDGCADILAQNSLRNNCNSIVAIFLQKALYGVSESSAPAPVAAGDEWEDQLSADEIIKKYKDLPED
jgi:hypothetical protein